MDVHIAAGLLLQDGRLLLGKRSAHRLAFPGVWDLPGGHVEVGETVEQALVRELREELGVAATSWREMDTLREPAANGEPDLLHLHIFVVSDWDGEPRNLLPDQHDEIPGSPSMKRVNSRWRLRCIQLSSAERFLLVRRRKWLRDQADTRLTI